MIIQKLKAITSSSSPRAIIMASQNKYAAAHEKPQGPGDARPTALQIVEDEGLVGKLSDKVVLVTGTSSGIGAPTVAAFAATGATVFAAARDEAKNKQALQGIEGKVEFLTLDLSSFESVRAAAADFLKRSGGKLNLLVNNAGVMAVKEQTLTVDGHEMQFGTNHLGHFLLFQLLKPALLASATPEFPSRVVNLSSIGHRAGGVVFDNLNLDGVYDPWKAYAQAKTANIQMASGIERRYGSQNLHGLAVHPGGIWTPLQRHMDQTQIEGWKSNPEVGLGMKSPEQGAATTMLAALGKEFEGRGRVYLEDSGDWGAAPESAGGFALDHRGHAKHAFDEESEDKLWTVSSKLVGVPE
jgi:NAD(P)-dependent dehydrogenase (short-subunit alcohol dehydrogenase family)